MNSSGVVVHERKNIIMPLSEFIDDVADESLLWMS